MQFLSSDDTGNLPNTSANVYERTGKRRVQNSKK